MTSTYYLSYQIRKSNGTTAWIRTPECDNEAEARQHYEYKITKPNVIECRLCRRDHYEPEEMMRPDKHPNGFDDFRIRATYSRI